MLKSKSANLFLKKPAGTKHLEVCTEVNNSLTSKQLTFKFKKKQPIAGFSLLCPGVQIIIINEGHGKSSLNNFCPSSQCGVLSFSDYFCENVQRDVHDIQHILLYNDRI